MRRLVAVVAVCGLAATAFVGTAAADRPTREVEDLPGEQIRCGEMMLTVTSGQFVGLQHVHKLRSGLYRVIFVGRTRHVRLQDEEGNAYRAVGTAQGNFRTPNPEEEGGEVGFFRFRVTIVGQGGKLGTVWFTERTRRNGQSTSVNRGNCELVED